LLASGAKVQLCTKVQFHYMTGAISQQQSLRLFSVFCSDFKCALGHCTATVSLFKLYLLRAYILFMTSVSRDYNMVFS